MSSTLRPFPIFDNGNNIATRRIVDSANGNIFHHAGDGVEFQSTSHGYNISVPSQIHKEAMRHAKEFDPTASYCPQDVVYVDPNKTYEDIEGNPIDDIAPGTLVCLRTVPEATATDYLFLHTIVPLYAQEGGTPSDHIANCYRWEDYNTYYPIDPEPTNESTQSVSGYNINVDVMFWKRVGGGDVSEMHPFKIYKSPSADSGSFPFETGSEWRTFRVRAGSVGFIDVDGTDGYNSDPYDSFIPPFDDTIEFQCSSSAETWVWINSSGSLLEVSHSQSPPDNGWLDGHSLPIGKITTNGSGSTIRQYLYTDVIETYLASFCDSGGTQKQIQFFARDVT